jgi:hypothetical protein
MTFNGKQLPSPDPPYPQPERPHRERNALADPQCVLDGGKLPRNQVNDRGSPNDKEEHLTLLMEILRLSPPSPGSEQRARLILRKFTLRELQILAKALRAGNHLKRP